MVYLLLWMFLGLVGYMLMAYRDINDTLDKPGLHGPQYYTKWEYTKGMAFALLLGPLTIGFFCLKE